MVKLTFILFKSHLPEKLKTFMEGKVDNMHEVFNNAVDALAQVGSSCFKSSTELPNLHLKYAL
jgi:hypothetical protein